MHLASPSLAPGHDGGRAQRARGARRQAGRGQDLRRAPLLHRQDAQGPAQARDPHRGLRPDARSSLLETRRGLV